MTDREPRTLVDPRAIKALAHPARLTVLDALADGDELTATECAAVASISPSAMSYHLRALEKWGFVQRAASSTDGRERPWRGVPGGWTVDALPNAAAATAASASSTARRAGWASALIARGSLMARGCLRLVTGLTLPSP
ncbi:MAG TPA: helix-turn-helix domain-containing protein [Jatrophihabitans sp.]|nr:helix-turn-helix domain-containing protein [Jatrophihabitans sp.]